MMKTLKLSALVMLLFFAKNAFSQSKEESIMWLKKNLPLAWEINTEFYQQKIDIISITECEIVVAYLDKQGISYVTTYATQDISTAATKSRKTISYNDIDGALSRKNGELQHYFVDGLKIKEAYMNDVLTYLDKLSTHCKNSDTVSWKKGNEKDAIKWLDNTFKKYAYTSNSKYARPRVQLIDSCKIAITYDYYESGYEWGVAEKTGTVTETIYTDADRIASDDNCFRSDRKDIFHKYSHDKNKFNEEGYRSVTGLKNANPELHNNVLRTLKFLSGRCKCGFICRMAESSK